jgi:Cro/C1-type HTH DNA-binding domain
MTGPERLVRSHMRSRGIRSIAELQRMLLAEGYELSYERVRRAVKYPTRARNLRALEAICEALQLGDEEMIRSISAPRRLRVFRY